jgi:UDP-2-acetamido-2,6-beta-L-arabino-hexul-4-ose reductase
VKVVITGGNGFLGFHLRALLHERHADVHLAGLGDRIDRRRLHESVEGADLVIHLAGVNRAPELEIEEGNVLFANQLADAITGVQSKPTRVVYAGSVQSNGSGVYADAKRKAGARLAEAASSAGCLFEEVRLPNLFGEHGRPFYNAVTSTFSYQLSRGEVPVVQQDRELELLHAQDAAEILVGDPVDMRDRIRYETVSGLLTRLRAIADIYASGELPDLTQPFSRDLFNTYRSLLWEVRPTIALTRRADQRGAFFEVVRSRGGSSQSSFSTTLPGVSRGQHYHRRKVERFTVIAGTGEIALRRLFTPTVQVFRVTGDAPVAIDMPTMWAHRVTNVGEDVLLTSFWVDEPFDPEHPDTIHEAVDA